MIKNKVNNLIYHRNDAFEIRRELNKTSSKKWHIKKVKNGWTLWNQSLNTDEVKKDG